MSDSGIRALSSLLIDVDKDWAGKKIENLGAPASANDVLRRRGSLADMPDMALDKIMVGQGSGSSPVEEDKPAAATLTDYQPSDDVRNSNDAAKVFSVGSYTKQKETEFNADLAAVRIKFAIKVNQGGMGTDVFGKIYKNGSPIGVERTNSSDVGATYSEDFANLVSGDLLQVYCYSDDSAACTLWNFQFCYIRKITHIGGILLETEINEDTAPISMTNNLE